MAQKVKLKKGQEFHFVSPKPGGAAQSIYPWDEWLSGDLLMLEQSQGERDAKLHTAARRRYKVVQVSRVDADGKRLTNALIIRARDMDADERELEDIQRADDKGRAAARKTVRREKAKEGGANPADSQPARHTGAA
jgi:hypothetical protein